MTEELEYIIAQYADGSLDEVQRSRVEALLAADPEARKLLEQYRRLDQTLRLITAPPAIDYERLGALISQQIDRADDQLELPTLKMPWVKSAVVRSLALAAAVVIGIGVVWRVFVASPVTEPVGPIGGADPVLIVSGPTPPTAEAAPVVQISIGPPPHLAEAELAIRYLETGLVARPSRVFIAGVTDSAQDIPLPF